MFGPIISKMAGNTDSATIEHLQETAPLESNGHVPGDVTSFLRSMVKPQQIEDSRPDS